MKQFLNKPVLSEWLDYIAHLHPFAIDMGLSRVSVIADQLGLTKIKCPVITVGGTNGKGSCVSFLENIYLAAKYKVGAYTSPHLLEFNERIRLDGLSIDDESLIKAFEVIEKARGNQTLTFFEFTTLAALYIFQQAPLDVLILEVGLGGRLDAVNVVDADLSVITTIDLDHMDRLGPTRDSIAREKVGIMRAGKPTVCGDPNPPDIILKTAEELNSSLFGFGKCFSYQLEQDQWHWSGPKKKYLGLPMLTLKYQNAATSLMVVELLQNRLPVKLNAIKEGLGATYLPGRFEKITISSIPCILDVGHNPQAAHWFAEQLHSESKCRTLAVIAMLKDKVVDQTLHFLLPLVDSWYLAGLDCPRGGDSSHIVDYLSAKKVKSWYNFASVKEAFAAALKTCHDGIETRIIVFGSFHTVAAVKEAFN